MQIFQNAEFGSVRTITLDNEPWFVGKDVAEALGYSNSRKALADHVDEDDKFQDDGVTIRDTIGREQTPTFINESGVYSLIFGSKLDNAKKFKKWVTSEVLPSIRKTGSYQKPMTTEEKIKLLAQGNTELNEKIETVKTDLEDFKQTMPLLAVDCELITRAVRKKAIEFLGGKESKAYKDSKLRSKTYSDLHREVKHQFGVATYKAIKRNQVQKAIDFINQYNFPYVLGEEVSNANN